MMTIQIINENLTPSTSQIIESAIALIEEDQKKNSFIVKKEFDNIKHTKGEVINNILITLGTSIASDIIVFFITEAIKRHFNKNKYEIKIESDVDNINRINVEVENADLKLKIEIKKE